MNRSEHVAILDIVAQVADALHVLLWSGIDDKPDFVSARWEDYTGVADWELAVHPDDLELVRRRGSTELEVRIRDRAGAYHVHRVSFVVARGRWFALATRLVRDHALEEYRLLAAISHELRAPITTLLLWERLLRDDSLDHAGRERALDAIHHSAVLQQRLVGDLLDVSRAISGKLHVDLRSISLDGVLSEVLEAARVRCEAKDQQLVARVSADLGPILGDVGRLEQVFENLLTNASKFTPGGGTIVVTARRDADSVVVEITDSGCGIAPELLARVFEPFSQGDQPLSRSEGGLGLGLAIAREIVGLHRGRLTAHSEGIGHGARFTAWFPLATEHAIAASSKHGALADVRVLLVDDDARVLNALQLLLERAGASVKCAASAAAAWTALQRELPDIVLSDIAMPGEDGYELVRRIRSAPGDLGQLPAVALTAHAATSDRERALSAGFDLHVPKPINVDKLVASVARLVARA